MTYTDMLIDQRNNINLVHSYPVTTNIRKTDDGVRLLCFYKEGYEIDIFINNETLDKFMIVRGEERE